MTKPTQFIPFRSDFKNENGTIPIKRISAERNLGGIYSGTVPIAIGSNSYRTQKLSDKTGISAVFFNRFSIKY
jgi:hypothetical protein